MNNYLRKKLTDAVGQNPIEVTFKRPPESEYIKKRKKLLASIKLPK